jgi:hypothetical protein
LIARDVRRVATSGILVRLIIWTVAHQYYAKVGGSSLFRPQVAQGEIQVNSIVYNI